MKFIYESFVAMLRLVRGGQFVWRDASDETVTRVAEMRPEDFHSNEVPELVRQAQEELTSRTKA